MRELVLFGGTVVVLLVGLLRLRWGLLAFVFLYASYPRVLAVGVGGEGFALSMQHTTLLALFLCWMIKLFLDDGKARQGIDALVKGWPLTLAISAYFVALILASGINGALRVSNLSALFNEILFSIVVIVVTVTCVTSYREVMLVMSALLAGLLVNVIAATGEVVLGEPLLKSLVTEVDYSLAKTNRNPLEGRYRVQAFRVQGTMTNSLLLTYYVVIMLPLVHYVYRFGRGGVLRTLALFGGILSIPTVFWTRSRGGMLLVTLFLGFYGFQYLMKRYRLGWQLKVLGSGAVAVLLLIAMPAVLDYSNRAFVQQDYSLEDGSTSRRLYQVGATISLASQKPLFGYGQQRNVAVDLITTGLDSFYLELVLESGLMGLVLWLALLAIVFWYIYRLLRKVEDPALKALVVSFAWFVSALVVSLAVIRQPYHLVYLYLVIGILLNGDRLREPASDAEPRPLAVRGVL